MKQMSPDTMILILKQLYSELTWSEEITNAQTKAAVVKHIVTRLIAEKGLKMGRSSGVGSDATSTCTNIPAATRATQETKTRANGMPPRLRLGPKS